MIMLMHNIFIFVYMHLNALAISCTKKKQQQTYNIIICMKVFTAWAWQMFYVLKRNRSIQRNINNKKQQIFCLPLTFLKMHFFDPQRRVFNMRSSLHCIAIRSAQ